MEADIAEKIILLNLRSFFAMPSFQSISPIFRFTTTSAFLIFRFSISQQECRFSFSDFITCNVKKQISKESFVNVGTREFFNRWHQWQVFIILRRHQDFTRKRLWIPVTAWMKSPNKYQGLFMFRFEFLRLINDFLNNEINGSLEWAKCR